MKTRTLFVLYFLLAAFPFSMVFGESPLLRTATNSFGMSVAVWYEKVSCTNQVFAQRQDPDGNSLGPVIRVNGDDWFDHGGPKVAIDDAGSFVVVWTASNGFERFCEVYLRRFDSNDNPSEIFRITYTNENLDAFSNAASIAITMPPSGKFAICWIEFEMVPVDGNPNHLKSSNFRLWIQQFTPDCIPMIKPLALTETIPYRYKWSVPADIFSEVSANEKEITVRFRKSLFEPVVEETLFWADQRPNVTLQYQREENPGDVVILTISPALTGKKYQVYYCDSLTENCWSLLGEPVIAESNSLTVIDNGGAASSPLRETKSRFYKVSLVH